MAKSRAVQLVQTKRGQAMLETKPRYDVMLNGRIYMQLYFNMTGYTGYLPVPPPADADNQRQPMPLNMGEGGISRFKKELADVNRRWDEWHAKGNEPILVEKPLGE